ncbi:Pentatricopeptide repeat-containing protein, putative isoform 2 [Hibiscus syriacus]|uniref:Pentatricopeptide repeat-containing protein, putative isoform 2 n=1 Tax=Hibiscus syriacus TaxID=106335 RepID=A0A6A3B2X6_HIBSY|nr:Pentatricopeptide repeat-containing protein, putative isoform 2 [Hibiscus syriacus]
MWRSMAARSTQLVGRGFRASQMNQVLSETRKPFNSFPKTSFPPFHRFFSHSSSNESWDPELDFIARIETNAAQVPSFEGLASDETQIDSFIPGDSKNDMEEEIQDYELDANRLENVLSLLQSKVDGSLESSLNVMALDLRVLKKRSKRSQIRVGAMVADEGNVKIEKLNGALKTFLEGLRPGAMLGGEQGDAERLLEAIAVVEKLTELADVKSSSAVLSMPMPRDSGNNGGDRKKVQRGDGRGSSSNGQCEPLTVRSQGKSSGKNGKAMSGAKKNVSKEKLKCYFCDDPHLIRECPEKRRLTTIMKRLREGEVAGIGAVASVKAPKPGKILGPIEGINAPSKEQDIVRLQDLKVQSEQVRSQYARIEAWSKLRRLRHKGTLKEYVSRFRRLMLKVQSLTEEDGFFTFMFGLKPLVKKVLERREVNDMSKALTTTEESPLNDKPDGGSGEDVCSLDTSSSVKDAKPRVRVEKARRRRLKMPEMLQDYLRGVESSNVMDEPRIEPDTAEAVGAVNKDGDYGQTEVVSNFSWHARVTRAEMMLHCSREITRLFLNSVKVLFSRLFRLHIFQDLVKEIGEKDTEVLTVDVLNELIALFSKLGKGKAAVEVFDKFSDFGCIPNAETYYFTIEALYRRSFYEWAWSVCEKMLDARSLPDGEPFGKIISWFCKGDKANSLCKKDETVKLASEMLDGFSGEARKYAIKPFSTVVRGLCRMKDVDEAKKAYTVVMSGYANCGQMDQACEVLSEAKKKHTKLTLVTYHTLIRGYCKLERFDKALKLLAEMKNFGVQPNVDEYNKLIQSLCLKVLDWQTVEKILNEMKENGLNLNGITRSLITTVKELEAEGMNSLEATIEV